jgi:DNA-binding transcriptional LysR family regulator
MARSGAGVPDLGALALFLAVIDAGSVGGAARRLGISQSAASQRMRMLERELGVTLLERGHAGSVVTTAGSVIAEWATRLVATGEDFQRNVGALAGQHRNELQVAASLTVADYLLPAWLVALHARLPDVSVSLRPANSEAVAASVLDGSAALGFIEGPSAPPGVHARALARDELVALAAPAHPLALAARPVSPTQLVDASLVLREPASGTRQVLDRALAQRGLTARPVMELGSTTAIKQALARGTDVSVLSVLSVNDDIESGRLVVLETPELDLSRVIRAIWKGASAPSGAAGALLALSVSAMHEARHL